LFDTKDILRYLEGRLSKKKVEEIDAWKESSKDNRDEFDQTKLIFDIAPEVKDIKIFDAEEEWSKFEKLLEEEEQVKVVPMGKRVLRIVGIAASFLIFGLLLFYFLKQEPLYKEIVTTTKIDTVLLVDGSKIFLGENSKLKYFTRIEKDTKKRYVELDGTATFDIVHNEKLPFVVFSNNAGIDVLGTVFKIEKKEESLVVENVSGVVKLFEWENAANSIVLHDGEKAEFSKEGIHKIEPEVIEEPVEMKGQFYTIDDIIESLFEKFESRITTAPYPNIALNERVFVDLEQSLDGILSQLEDTSNIKYRKTCKNCYEISVLRSK